MRVFFWGACLGWAAAAVASDVTGDAGAFASPALGARAAALAGAQTAGLGAEAASLNPAALADVGEWAAAYSYAESYGMFPGHRTAAAGRMRGKPWVAGVGWSRSGDDVYSENEILFSGAYRRGQVSLGGDYKFRFAGMGAQGAAFRDPVDGLDRQVTGSALGWLGFDLGAVITPFGPKYRLGFVARDLLSRISWDTRNGAGTAQGHYAEYVPVKLRYGFLFDPDPFLDFSVDFEPSLYHDGHTHFATGLEVVPLEKLRDGAVKRYVHDAVALRLGYARNLFETQAAHQLALGGGFGLRARGLRLDVDLAYELNFDFESANHLRMGLRLGR